MSFFFKWKNDRQTCSQCDNSGLHEIIYFIVADLKKAFTPYTNPSITIRHTKTILRSHFRQQEKTDLPVCYQIKWLSLEPKNSSLLVTVASDSVCMAKTACCALTRDSKTKSLKLLKMSTSLTKTNQQLGHRVIRVCHFYEHMNRQSGISNCASLPWHTADDRSVQNEIHKWLN